MTTPPFQSMLRYDPQRMHVAAMYCSDGRIGEHFDDFLKNGLNLPRYDRLALPGGPACLAGYTEARVEQDGIVDELRFLIDAHALTRVVLIQHQDCAFYTARLKVQPRQLEHLQRADLVRAAYFIRHVTSLDRIDAYFARRIDKRWCLSRSSLNSESGIQLRRHTIVRFQDSSQIVLFSHFLRFLIGFLLPDGR